MPSVVEAAAEAARRLGHQVGARDEAYDLIGAAMGLPTAAVLRHLRDPLPDGAAARLNELVTRRLAGEPLAYLTGYIPFAGHRFAVGPDVLIPRPETELLVDWAEAWLSRRRESLRVIDVGTGSGAIVVSLAARHAEREACRAPSGALGIAWHASDVSSAALDVARANAARLAPSAAIQWHPVDLLPPEPAQFDLIVANLPYVGTDERAEVQSSVFDYEPHGALFAGPDGLDLIRRLVAMLPSRLAAGGAVGLEIGWRQGPAVAALLRRTLPDAITTLHHDWNELERMVTVDAPPHHRD